MNVSFQICALLFGISAVLISMKDDEFFALLKDIALWIVAAVALISAAKWILF